ncbi:hypothetical protein HPB47_004128 [Ixodes persulcatus]|uniref:Uncharacterized protein n=1 Tax=Ixodes persulcatus TaxID=34615 RepID=A0AC60PGR5_IXOPE|nr:hypothetical protein HPB47_004128 [Ixodes persulcatus]
MKVAILFALAAVASAGHVHAPVVHAAAVLESGHSSQHRTQDLAGNYKFGYKESHTSGGSFRQEAGDAWGNKVGSYGLTDADGRVRVVKYVADGHGFRASVHTNEPGTAASHPAAASFDAPHKVAAVGVAVAAPVAKETSNFDRKGHSHGAGGGASWQKETADSSGNVVGSYGLRNVDGRFRVVNYVAGDAGFRADVQSNEPGLQGPTGGNPYSFSYDGTSTGGSFHSETGDASGIKRGSYGLPGRTVNYVADAGGFRATVTSNEAGVDTAQSPADVTVSSGSGAPGPPPGDTPSDLPGESGDAAGNKKGVYGLKDPDGRFRTVNYVADAGGFRASVQTNEPGVDDAQSPADVAVNKQSPSAGGYLRTPLQTFPAEPHWSLGDLRKLAFPAVCSWCLLDRRTRESLGCLRSRGVEQVVLRCPVGRPRPGLVRRIVRANTVALAFLNVAAATSSARLRTTQPRAEVTAAITKVPR